MDISLIITVYFRWVAQVFFMSEGEAFLVYFIVRYFCVLLHVYILHVHKYVCGYCMC